MNKFGTSVCDCGRIAKRVCARPNRTGWPDFEWGCVKNNVANSGSDDLEVDLIRARYLRRTDDIRLKSQMAPHRYMANGEKHRAMLALLGDAFDGDLSGRHFLEMGAGFGDNMLQMLVWGADPDKMVGNDLMEDRCAHARLRLPDSVKLLPGDALQLDLEPASFDIVMASTVFSSILDLSFRSRLANHAWSLVKPGGGILWYDFIRNNPSNPDVRKVGIAELRALFPEADVRLRRVTLAPPLARLVCRLHPSLYTGFNTLPFLRTHIVAWIRKPQ